METSVFKDKYKLYELAKRDSQAAKFKKYETKHDAKVRLEAYE